MMLELNDSIKSQKKIKVAYILTPITFGGAERVSLNFLHHVDRSCFELTLIVLLRPWEEEPFFVKEVRNLGYKLIILPVSIKKGGDPLRVPRVAWRIWKILRKGGFDVVHTHGYFADICALPSAYMLRIPSVTTCHGFIGNDNKLRLYNKIDLSVIKLCRNIIVVSEDIKRYLTGCGVNVEKIAVITNAVDTSLSDAELKEQRTEKRAQIGIADETFVVGYLGRLSPEKGVIFLIDAVAQLVSDNMLVKLLVVGDGDDREVLEDHVKELGIGQNVIFAGFQIDAAHWLPAFDLFVLPSLTEGTPMALLEAMAFGVPIIASAVGGIPDIIDDEYNGFLVAKCDVDELSKKINHLLSDKTLREKIVIKAHERVLSEYNIIKWKSKIESYY